MARSTLARIATYLRRLGASAAPMGENAADECQSHRARHPARFRHAARRPRAAARRARRAHGHMVLAHAGRSRPRACFDGVIVLGGDGQPGRHRRRRAARPRARGHRRRARARRPGARHLPRRAADRAGAPTAAPSACPQGEVGWVRSRVRRAPPPTTRCSPARRARSTCSSGTTTRARPPAGAAILARSEACVQAFRVGRDDVGRCSSTSR